MVIIEVCLGSSCFLKGADQVVQAFQKLAESLPPGKVDIRGSFCMGRCQEGVTVRIGDHYFTGVRASDAPRIFDEFVRQKVSP